MTDERGTLFDSPDWEWGVAYKGVEYEILHRWGMTEDEAREWVRHWPELGGVPDVVSVVKRSLGPWERA